MKKLFVSIGLVAAGAASIQTAHADGGGVDSKVWSVSASLRGFYDDNYSTSPTSKGSYGLEVSPSLSISAPLGQSEIGLRYIYGLYYYQERDRLNQNAFDQSHQVDLWLDHAFNERWHGKVNDTFVVAQEPQLLNAGTPYRVEGDNFANNGTVTLDTDWTREISTEATYNIGFYDFQNSGANAANFGVKGATLAGELNRIDNSIDLNFQWHMDTETTFMVGYIFDQINYTGDEPIAVNLRVPGTLEYSDSRDNRSHTLYVGATHNFLANLSVNARVGVNYNDSYNQPADQSSYTPYVNLSAIYTYLPGSYAQIGFTHELNATDVVAPDTTPGSKYGTLTENQETSTVYASINHSITSKLQGSVIGQWQNSSFTGGAYDSDTENDYNLGVSLTYNITTHFSADAGYSYDKLDDSSVPGRGYSRNRVYVGVSAAY